MSRIAFTLSSASVETFSARAIEAGKPGSCHVWRHTAATPMHDGGADIRDVQEMRGHAQLSTTQIYTHVSIERLKAVHAKTHPAHLVHARAPFAFAAEVAASAAQSDRALVDEHHHRGA